VDGEDPAAYDELRAKISAGVKPADIFEQIWVRDLADLDWEVMRWRRLKVNLMNATAYKGLEKILRPWAEGQKRAIRQVDKLLASSHQLLSRLLTDPYYETRADNKEADKRQKEKVFVRLMRKNALVPALAALEALEQCDPPSTLEGPHKFAIILSGEAKELLAMDRYERRALSRRKFAIQAFDEARRRSSDDLQ
jgi:hypothetical protein